MPDARRVLRDAIGTGELISIVYFGGSQPGHRREILPLRVTDEHVHATCAETGERRTFLLDKLALADGELAGAPHYSKAGPQAANVPDIAAFAAALIAVRPPLSVHLVVDADRIAVSERFKSGKPKKQVGLEIRRAGEIWIVGGKDAIPRRYRRFDLAAAAFLESDWWADGDRQRIENAMRATSAAGWQAPAALPEAAPAASSGLSGWQFAGLLLAGGVAAGIVLAVFGGR